MLWLPVQLCFYILTVQSKVIFPSNAQDFKDIARRFVPDALANQIANLVYQSTTERDPSDEYTDDETGSHEESEYAEINKRTRTLPNRQPVKTVKINLNELVEKVREKLLSDGRFYPKILKRGNKDVVITEEDGMLPDGNGRQKGQTNHRLPETNKGRQSQKQSQRQRPQNRERPAPARITTQHHNEQKTNNNYDYPEPDNVPAPKPKGKRQRPKSDLYETIKIKSKNKKDSYEDYVTPPREYDVFASDEGDKGKNKRIDQPQGQGSFIGEALGDETDVPTPKKKWINQKVQKRPIKNPKVNNDNARETNNVNKKQKQQDYQEVEGNNQQNYDDYDKPKPKRGGKRQPDYDNEDQQKDRQQKPAAKKIINRKPIKKLRNQEPAYADNNNKPVKANIAQEPAYADYDNNKPVKANKAVQKAPDYLDYVQPEKQNGRKPPPDYEQQYEKAVTKRGNKRQDDQGMYDEKELARYNDDSAAVEETTEYTEPTEVYVDEDPQSTTPQDLKVRTENIGDDYDEDVKPGAHLNGGGVRADLPSTPKQKKGTNIPTREIFTMSSPDYYNKQPKVAEKYNFKEPIPEGDREPENTKSWMGPPAKINGKVAAAG